MSDGRKVFKDNKTGRVAVHLVVYGGSVAAACRACNATPPVGHKALEEVIGGRYMLGKLQAAYSEYIKTRDNDKWESECSGSAPGLAQAVARHAGMDSAGSKEQSKADVIAKIRTCSDEHHRMSRFMQYNMSRHSPDDWILFKDLGL